ncbi:cytidylyltransferase domain-containing protein [Marinobacterium sp. LSUCC0821]|uniref:acylneuraminate cytidylyltransferase family protein n=1 Tax=Marinobacterium sp. LSUCC0821 TaxID=2668067 RepID=UPI00145138E0|nr:acylneuraminate cytidylyltransferase family protein [Marinobacterium sp. LSUCC0821]QJD72159.1 acylneuraminate cytidylyltransferase family protein [Marinobacterium sp. LSUCC0821]
MSNRIAIIPARGGSKRIPKKNIIDFFGVPMIARTIQAALESGCFERVLVSTDDPAIADVSRAHGAEVPFLRLENADDHSPISEATLSALAQAEAHWAEIYDTVVQLMANCPLRNSDDIRKAVAAFDNRSAQFQISSFKFGWMNPWWAAKLDANGTPERVFPEAIFTRSQDLESLYCPTGAVWVAECVALKQAGTFYGDGYVFENMPWTSAVDVDEYEDLEMAKAVFLMQNSSSND